MSKYLPIGGSGGGDTTALENQINTVEGQVTTLENQVSDVSGIIAENPATGKVELKKGADVVAEFDETGADIPHSVRTGVGSFGLGGVFTIGSGGERVLVMDQHSSEACVFTGPCLGADGARVQVQKEFVFSSDWNFIENGSSVTYPADAVTATWQSTPAENVVLFSTAIIPLENYTGKLRYKSTLISSGEVAVQFDQDAVTLTSGTPYELFHSYPILAPAGEAVEVSITKEDGTPLSVRKGAADNSPYTSSRFRGYKTQPLFHTSYVNSSTDLFQGGRYMVDCSGGPVTLSPKTSHGMTTIEIHDYANTFSATRPCTLLIEGMSNVVITRPSASIVLYIDPEPRWLDLKTGEGGALVFGGPDIVIAPAPTIPNWDTTNPNKFVSLGEVPAGHTKLQFTFSAWNISKVCMIQLDPDGTIPRYSIFTFAMPTDSGTVSSTDLFYRLKVQLSGSSPAMRLNITSLGYTSATAYTDELNNTSGRYSLDNFKWLK